MASKCNSAPKAELLALCRLEFYKKKKKWKFVQDVCKKDVAKVSQEPPPNSEPQPESTGPQESKPTLDETYDVIIEPELDADDGNPDLSMRNDVFMESDLDQIPPTTPRGLAAGGWPGPNATPGPGPSWGLPQQGPDLTGRMYGPEAQGQAWSRPAEQEWGGEAVYAEQTQDFNNLGLGCSGWLSPACGQGMLRDERRPGAVLSAAEDHRVSPHQWRSEDDCHSLSIDSVSEFMRGAAAAPHSSVIELSLSDASESSLESISKHAASLRLLLQEAEQMLQLSASPQTSLSLEWVTLPYNPRYEFPTQDLGANQNSNAYLPTGSYTGLTGGLGDPFVAGSYRNVDVGIGRGRGRLNRERLIGIGMGRPYRLSREN